MPIKIENTAGIKLPAKTEQRIQAIIDSLPREHLRGIDRLRLVDKISDPRLKLKTQASTLPGIYQPRQGSQPARLEIAMGVLLASSEPLLKRFMPRLSFKGNLAAVIFSLVGQHYYMTLRHSIKMSQVESAVRAYTEKQLRHWHETQHSTRSKLFKPFQPTLERWGRALQKRAAAERKKSS